MRYLFRIIKLLLLFVLLILPTYAFGFSPVMVFSSGVGAVECTPDTDGSVFDWGNVYDTIDGFYEAWYAGQFVTTETLDITGIYFSAVDDGNGRGATCEVYPNGTSPEEPTETIYGAGFTATIANLPDSDYATQEYLFAATQSLPAGTYWIVCKSVGGGISVGYENPGGTGEFRYDTSQLGLSYNTQSAGYGMVGGLLGCEP